MTDEARETRVLLNGATNLASEVHAYAHAPGAPGGAPVYFGPPAAPRFGWWHTPMQPSPGPVVVLCPAPGYEGVCTYRFQRTLARVLARAGLPTLRFAWHGTGDSDGSDADAARVATWLDDVALAVDEARRHSGRSQVALVGTRLGATLAALAAARLGGVDTLVMLAPFATGRAFVRETRAFAALLDKELGVAPPGAYQRAADDVEAAGFLFSAETLVALGGLDLGGLREAPARRVLIVPRDDLPGAEAKLHKQLDALGVASELRALPGYAALMQDPHKSVVPAEIVGAIGDVLGVRVVLDGVDAAPLPAPGARARVRSGHGDVRVEEHALVLGEGERVFAIASQPIARPAVSTVLVWLNAGAIDHNGPNRLYTRLSRQWAAEGLTCVRVDLPCLGDSPPAPGQAENSLYSNDTVPEVRRILSALETQLGARQFVLAGLCSGAYAAWHTARVDARVVGTILINPQTFHFKEGDSLDIGARMVYREVQHYQRRFFQLDAWKKLLAGGVNLRNVADIAARRARDLAETRFERVLLRLGRGDATTLDLIAGFHELERRQVRTLLVFSDTDPGLDYLTSRLGPELRLLGKHSHLRLDILDGADHTFTPLWTQELLCERLSAHVRSEMGLGGTH